MVLSESRRRIGLLALIGTLVLCLLLFVFVRGRRTSEPRLPTVLDSTSPSVAAGLSRIPVPEAGDEAPGTGEPAALAPEHAVDRPAVPPVPAEPEASPSFSIPPREDTAPPPQSPPVLVKIAMGENGFSGPLSEGDRFGASVAEIGDLDGDGIRELAVGAPGDDAAGAYTGAVWVLFLSRDGRVRSERKITPENIEAGSAFGHSLCALHRADGRIDLVVGISLASAESRLSWIPDGAIAEAGRHMPWAAVCRLELDSGGGVTRAEQHYVAYSVPHSDPQPGSVTLTLAAPPGPCVGNCSSIAIGFRHESFSGYVWPWFDLDDPTPRPDFPPGSLGESVVRALRPAAW